MNELNEFDDKYLGQLGYFTRLNKIIFKGKCNWLLLSFVDLYISFLKKIKQKQVDFSFEK